MSLGRKLLSGFGAMLALVLLTGGGALVVTRDLNNDLNRAASVIAREQYLAGEVSAGTSAMAKCEQGTVLAEMLSNKERSRQYQEEFQTHADNLHKSLNELVQLTKGGEAETTVKSLDQQTSLVLQAHMSLSQAVATDKMDQALDIFNGKVLPRVDEIDKAATSLVDQENRELAAASVASQARSWRVTALVAAFTLLGLGVGIVVFMIVRHATRSLKGLSAKIAESATHVASAAKQVSSASQSLAQGASQQAASLEETSASTEEIVSITHKNADHASEVADLMQKTEQASIESDRTLDRMVEQMKEIDGSSHKIARIIKVIDEIAFQTNILALNAAVEAARAGEAGLGFAVVADEVRNLAQRCAQAARDTAALIEESIATAADGNAKLDQMAGAVRSMTQSAVRVKALVDQVNLGSQEQSRGMEQISRAIIQMEQVTQRTAAGAEQSASAGTELDAHASTLRDLVHEMREMVGTE
ncbi:MAG TPA: methyl-accepting chemotaxis protein [Bryobacteraceae bacterium]|nr:methyl-accepting chemotaxis protein [Bryobacteraceae bacterium]